MAKEFSDHLPTASYQIEQYAPGWCDIVLYADAQQMADGNYQYEVYRLAMRPYTDGLEADIAANFDTWLATAQQEDAAASLPTPTLSQRLDRIEAALIELAGIIAGVGDDMAQIYFRWVLAGWMTIDAVPERWRAEVQSLIAASNQTPSEPA